MRSEIATYGNNSTLPIIRHAIRTDGVLSTDNIQLERASLSIEAYEQALEDINRTWTVLTDRQTGKTLELAIGNPHSSAGDDIEESTLRSSLSGNSGNTKEFAEHVARNTDRRRIYLANSGNGKSSFYDLAERKWLRKTGSFIGPDGTPLPTIAAKARILERAGITPRRASVDSAGGAAITALAHALPEGQMSHFMIKSRTNVANHALPMIWGARMALGDMRDGKALAAVSRDPRALHADQLAGVHLAVPRLYSADPAVNAANIYAGLSRRNFLAKTWTDTFAYARGGTNCNGMSPAARDTALMLRQQPTARVTFYVPSADRLYKDPIADFERLLQQIARAGAIACDDSLQVLHVPGTHSDHTQYPSLRAAVEAYAFAR